MRASHCGMKIEASFVSRPSECVRLSLLQHQHEFTIDVSLVESWLERLGFRVKGLESGLGFRVKGLEMGRVFVAPQTLNP